MVMKIKNQVDQNVLNVIQLMDVGTACLLLLETDNQHADVYEMRTEPVDYNKYRAQQKARYESRKKLNNPTQGM